jgi:hypothetical protein
VGILARLLSVAGMIKENKGEKIKREKFSARRKSSDNGLMIADPCNG